MAMTLFPWERAPFFSNPGLLEKNARTKLPFSVGALSRRGSLHARHGMNNQDAIQIVLQDACIVGILCDGTSSSHPSIKRDFSNNEVGANLLSFLIAQTCLDAIAFRKGISPKLFVHLLDTSFRKRYRDLAYTLSGKTRKSKITSHFLTTTCLGIMILEREYFVFGAGDGIIHHNGKSIVLERTSSFLSGNLLTNKRPVLRLIAYGNTDKLDHVSILSDGFQSQKALEHPSLIKFLEAPGLKPGFSDISSSFHTEVLNQLLDKTRSHWPQDDASCLVIQRVKEEVK